MTSRIRTQLHDPFLRLLLVVVVILALFPLARPAPYFMDLLFRIFMFACLASSFNIIGGFTGYVSFGQVAFYGIGAYITALLMKDWGISPFLTTPPAGVTGAILAAVLGYIVLRFRGSYFAIVTASMTMIFETMVFNLKEITYGGVGISLPLLPYPMWMIKTIFYYAMLILMLATIFTSFWITNSRFGLFLFSIRDNEDAAEAMGVNTTKYKILAFAISAFFTAMAGGLYAPYMSYIDPPTVFAISTTVMMILMAVLGGIGTVIGPVIGATILTVLSDFLIGLIGSELNMVLYGALLVAVILFMPLGIIGLIREKFPRFRVILK